MVGDERRGEQVHERAEGDVRRRREDAHALGVRRVVVARDGAHALLLEADAAHRAPERRRAIEQRREGLRLDPNEAGGLERGGGAAASMLQHHVGLADAGRRTDVAQQAVTARALALGGRPRLEAAREQHVEGIRRRTLVEEPVPGGEAQRGRAEEQLAQVADTGVLEERRAPQGGDGALVDAGHHVAAGIRLTSV